jgi:hypothetical protein
MCAVAPVCVTVCRANVFLSTCLQLLARRQLRSVFSAWRLLLWQHSSQQLTVRINSTITAVSRLGHAIDWQKGRGHAGLRVAWARWRHAWQLSTTARHLQLVCCEMALS